MDFVTWRRDVSRRPHSPDEAGARETCILCEAAARPGLREPLSFPFAILLRANSDRTVCRLHPTLPDRSEEHTSELQSHSFISYAVFCLKKKKNRDEHTSHTRTSAQQRVCHATPPL